MGTTKAFFQSRDTLYALIQRDFSKAFDKVPHRRLLLKLSEYGLCSQMLSWIKDFLSGRIQSVAMEGSNSEPKEVLSGVPQGTALAPHMH